MTKFKVGRWLAACLCLAAFPAGAAEPSSSTQSAKRPAAGSVTMSVRGENPEGRKSSRLKFRGPDTTCPPSAAGHSGRSRVAVPVRAYAWPSCVETFQIRSKGAHFPPGTCACTCASGGITEEQIRKAQEARERAS